MKCRLIRDELITHPDLKCWDDVHALGRQLHDGTITADQFNQRIRIAAPAGTIIDHPQAYLLVAMGRAEPCDEECKSRAAGIMPEGHGDFDFKLAAAFEAADRLDNAQITGDPKFDATPEQVELMKKAREERIAKAG
jgi:hypothetical protein